VAGVRTRVGRRCVTLPTNRCNRRPRWLASRLRQFWGEAPEGAVGSVGTGRSQTGGICLGHGRRVSQVTFRRPPGLRGHPRPATRPRPTFVPRPGLAARPGGTIMSARRVPRCACLPILALSLPLPAEAARIPSVLESLASPFIPGQRQGRTRTASHRGTSSGHEVTSSKHGKNDCKGQDRAEAMRALAARDGPARPRQVTQRACRP
jgi:hypothetical protein